MTNRRQFIKKAAKFFLSALALPYTVFPWMHKVLALTKRIILPADFPIRELMFRDPKSIDSSNIDITPLKDFGTMGVTDQRVDMTYWRLKIYGNVKRSLELTLSQIQNLPSIKKKILMICPGFFSNQGLWKGVNMKALLDKARPMKNAEKIVFYGANGESTKMETFPIVEIKSGEIFLAYEVNGVPLPRKHGFPLRVVARDYYGDDWVKYVYEMKVI